MKILILGNSAGGTYNFRKELLQELIKRNHEVFLSVPNDDYVERIEALGCKVIITEFNRRGMNPKQEQILYKKYCKIIKEVKPDKILTYTIKPNIYGGIAARKHSVPQIATITGLGTALENEGIKRKALLSLYKRGLKKSQVVFFQNQTNCDFFTENNIFSNRVKVVSGSGVNLKSNPYEDYPKESNELVFLTIGRIMKDKGIDELLFAANKIKKNYPNVRFKLIGYYDEDYQSKIEQAEYDGYIEFLGLQDDVHYYIKNSHATISASYHEGMSNVLQETAASGRPVIATDIPGSIETFEPNVSGISFSPHDSEGLVKAIKDFIEMPYKQKAQMGLAGHKRMEKMFDRQIVVNKYIEEIEKEV